MNHKHGSLADFGAGEKEILEATAVAVALCGSVADWPAQFVAKVLEDIGTR